MIPLLLPDVPEEKLWPKERKENEMKKNNLVIGSEISREKGTKEGNEQAERRGRRKECRVIS